MREGHAVFMPSEGGVESKDYFCSGFVCPWLFFFMYKNRYINAKINSEVTKYKKLMLHLINNLNNNSRIFAKKKLLLTQYVYYDISKTRFFC